MDQLSVYYLSPSPEEFFSAFEVVEDQGKFIRGEGACSLLPPAIDAEGNLSYRVEFSVDREGVRLQSLTMVDMTGSGLRLRDVQTISLNEIKRTIMSYLEEHFFSLDLLERKEKGEPIGDAIFQFELVRFREDNWPNGENLGSLLRLVCREYNYALRQGIAPTMYVASQFETSRTTASRMIAKAREEGLQLGSPVPYPGKRTKTNAKKKTKDR